ncbi:MAG: enoyl-CoA hydratase/isomerase family protein [Bacteriovoracaceae bacterium]|nr:enoyl-CoA hydratase/isomerase family protein [Bacteriovoracaceae bacterium]
MNELFSYSTLKVGLSKSTRTLNISFKKGCPCITLENLFELESILAWATNRVEIKSILISSENEFFSEGIDKERLSNMSAKKLAKMSKKLQTIVHAMYHLPQTIVMDLAQGSFDFASELALGADIRVSSEDSSIAFNHNRVGLVPSSGGIGFLSVIVGQAMARNWTLTGKKISNSQLLMSGFISEQYTEKTRQECIEALLQSIAHCAPVQRIQTKLGLLEHARLEFERATKYERSVSEAAMVSEDWKENDNEFMGAKSMSQSVKLSIVKDAENKSKEPPLN